MSGLGSSAATIADLTVDALDALNALDALEILEVTDLVVLSLVETLMDLMENLEVFPPSGAFVFSSSCSIFSISGCANLGCLKYLNAKSSSPFAISNIPRYL